ncbi:unnamed protein product [Urochloa decumbens]|uniref:F-box domain-containing protein n=1 Tax=Urochloa decumbens TaxID=240449 RepID=A0ABC9BHB3_9POAL
MAHENFDLPDDALVQILLLLPTSSRRRCRLVCKRWRDLIDERTPERQSRTKILTFFAERGESRALVFDDEGGGRRHAWTYPCSTATATIDIVGTCNGLLCLHETLPPSEIDDGSSSVISVTNPITGETQVLPPAPAPAQRESGQFGGFGKYSFGYHPYSPTQRESGKFGKYSFGYHPITGEYKVVHIPFHRDQEVDAVWVFTLGRDTTSWREVPVTAPRGSYSKSKYCGEVVSVDGVMYWLNAASNRIMELDLGDERATWLDVPPSVWAGGLTPEEGGGGWRLTSVHARLGIAATTTSWGGVLVWVLDGRPRWAQGRTLPKPHGHHGSSSWITAAPHFTYGEYAMSSSGCGSRTRLYRHKVGSLIGRDGEDGWLLRLPADGVAELVTDKDDGTPYYSEMKTFAYVETLEPLPGY